MFCFGIGLRCFSNKASSPSDRRSTNLFPFPSLCWGSEAFSWFIHQENEVSWQKFDRCLATAQRGVRLQECHHPHAGPSRAASLEVKFCSVQNKNSFRSHCRSHKVLQVLKGLLCSCEISVAFIEQMGILLVLSPLAWIPAPKHPCFLLRRGTCLSRSRLQPVCQSAPFLRWGIQVHKTYKREACKHLANREGANI